MAGCPAIALFSERARAVRPDFSLNPGNVQAVMALCTRVDGLPLGIELIAAQVRWMSPQVLLNRINDQWIMYENSRRAESHRLQSLYNAIDWSYSLLSPEEQRLFAHLSIFSGGFTLTAGESLTEYLFYGQKLPKTIMALMEKSLLQPVPGRHGEARFTMLRTIQQYASMRLEKWVGKIL